MAPSAFSLTIWAAMIPVTLHSYQTQYITTTRQEYLYAYQGRDGDNNDRPNYITIAMIDETVAYSHSSQEGSRFVLMPPDDENGFSLHLSLDSPLTFHPTQITKLTLQIGSDTAIAAASCELIVSFSQSSSTYLSSMISIAEISDNLIYPACDASFPYIQSLADGDIQQIVDTQSNCNRLCKAFGHQQNSSAISRFEPTSIPPNIAYPLTFILENHPKDNYSIFSYVNPGVQRRSCGFAQAWQANTGLDIFLSPNINQQFDITYMNITHVLYATYSPTLQPTAQPTQMTQYPTFYPSQYPIQMTQYPTFYPTQYPTFYPSPYPTLEPSSVPTLFPSQTPTFYPTLPVTSQSSTESTHIFTFNSTFIVVESTLQNTNNSSNSVKVRNERKFNFDILMFIVVGVVIFCFVLIGLDYIYLKRYVSNVTDEMHYDMIIVVGLRLSNMTLDVGILYRMAALYYNDNGNVLLMMLVLFSLLLLVLTYLMNLFSMHKIVKLQCQTEGPVLWFSKYMLLFVFLVFITCDSYLIVKLISCNIYGMEVFNSGHSTVEIKKIRWIKFVTIVLQNIPQMIIQIIFAALVLRNMSVTILISVIISFILSIPLLISWSLTNMNNKLFVWQEYDIEILLSLNESDTRVTTEDTDITVTKYGGNKGILKKKLSSILAINANELEIGFIDDRKTDNLIRIHILHQIPATNKERNCKSDLTVLYEGKYDILAKELRQIYNIPFQYNILCRLLMDGCAADTTPLTTLQSTVNDTEMVHIKVSTKTNKMAPFELITSRSEAAADYEDAFIHQILDETHKQMADNKNNNAAALMVVNDNDGIIQNTKSVIAVTPMGDDGDVEGDGDDSSSSNSDESEPDLPSERKENEFRKHFKRLSSVDIELSNLPLPHSIINGDADMDAFGGAHHEEDNNPFIMVNIDDIPQPEIEGNVGVVDIKGNQGQGEDK